MLFLSVERTVGLITDRVFRQPHVATPKDRDKARDKAAEWLDDIMRCVDAVRGETMRQPRSS
jgi:hypothetical protein